VATIRTGDEIGIMVMDALGIPQDTFVSHIMIDLSPQEPARVHLEVNVRNPEEKDKWTKVAQALVDAKVVVELYDVYAAEQVELTDSAPTSDN